MTNDELAQECALEVQSICIAEMDGAPGDYAFIPPILDAIKKAVEVNAAAWEKERKLRISDRDYTKDLKRKHAEIQSECAELKKRASEWVIVCDEFDSIKAESVRLRKAADALIKRFSRMSKDTELIMMPTRMAARLAREALQPSTQPADGKTT